ncbi:MAG TPA: hypothetical protein VMG12_11785 [Polyangiaceae bacterium]|nr:hypothetical protein [Polyangiaceae bacterium]
MATDHATTFLANPGTFIQNHSISLLQIASKTNVPARQNNLTRHFTLSQETKWLGLAWVDPIPSLRMLPGVGGGGLQTLFAYYMYAGDGNDPLDAIPYCDIPVNPGAAAAKLLFTVGMNGCTLIIATAVPPTAPALPANHWRVLHDHSHYSLATWHAGGYAVRFASYADANEAGAVPGAFAAALNQRCYNRRGHPWHYAVQGKHGVWMRVVTNFLHWDGAAWNYHSVHFHNYATEVNDVDAPTGGLSSTESVPV